MTKIISRRNAKMRGIAGPNTLLFRHGGDINVVEPTFLVLGPYLHNPTGTEFWFRVPEGAVAQANAWEIGFDIDADPEPDIWVNLIAYLATTIGALKSFIEAKATANGWTG